MSSTIRFTVHGRSYLTISFETVFAPRRYTILVHIHTVPVLEFEIERPHFILTLPYQIGLHFFIHLIEAVAQLVRVLHASAAYLLSTVEAYDDEAYQVPTPEHPPEWQ